MCVRETAPKNNGIIMTANLLIERPTVYLKRRAICISSHLQTTGGHQAVVFARAQRHFKHHLLPAELWGPRCEPEVAGLFVWQTNRRQRSATCCARVDNCSGRHWAPIIARRPTTGPQRLINGQSSGRWRQCSRTSALRAAHGLTWRLQVFSKLEGSHTEFVLCWTVETAR